MSSFPSSPAWVYPVTRTLQFQTGIARGTDGTEQRWMITTGIESWELPYARLTLAQRDTLLSFFESSKGSFDATFDFTFEGTTFQKCHFEDDELAFTERSPKQWFGTVKLKQVYRAPDSSALGSDFPTLASGAPGQYPFTHSRAFDTVSVRTDGGRSSYYKRASSAKAFSVGGPSLQDSEALAIWDYFRLAHGMHAQFAYTDVDSATRYTNCRFAGDTLSWRYLGRRVNAIDAQVVAL